MPQTNKPNARCAICGKEYYLCVSCKKNDATLVWKRHCDTPEHYKIYQLVKGYTTGVYTKAEAKKRLKRIDTSDLDSLRDNIRAIILEITGGDAEGEKLVDYDRPVETVKNEQAVEARADDAKIEATKAEGVTNNDESSTSPRRTRKRTVAKKSDEATE